MNSELLLFLTLGLAAVVSAIGMLQSKNAVYSAIFLIINFVTVAIFYLILGAPFISMAQITVYAGAIMVLFLFVIMLLGAEELQSEKHSTWRRPVAIFLGFVLAADAIYVIFFRAGTFAPGAALVETFGNPQAVGTILFTDYLLPFEVTGLLLLAAMVGAIVLSRVRRPHGIKAQRQNSNGDSKPAGG